MACVAERTCGAVSVTRDCGDIPQCSMADPCCEWTLSWNYKIVNDWAIPAEVKSIETTLCHGHCHGGMAPFGECLEESDPECNTLDLASSLMPSGQTIGAGEMKVARVEAWTTINLSGMDGAKIYGNSTVILKASEGYSRTGEASQCIDLCGEALMSRADGAGGATNDADAVIVDSIIIDEKILEHEEGENEVSDSLAPTTVPPTDAPVTSRPMTDAPSSVAPVTPEPTPSPSTVPVSAIPTSAPVTPEPTASPSTLPVSTIPTSAPVTPGPTPSPISDAPVTPGPTSSPSTLPVSAIPTSTPTIGPTNIPTDILAVIAEPRTNPAPCKVSVSFAVQ